MLFRCWLSILTVVAYADPSWKVGFEVQIVSRVKVEGILKYTRYYYYEVLLVLCVLPLVCLWFTYLLVVNTAGRCLSGSQLGQK